MSAHDDNKIPKEFDKRQRYFMYVVRCIRENKLRLARDTINKYPDLIYWKNAFGTQWCLLHFAIHYSRHSMITFLLDRMDHDVLAYRDESSLIIAIQYTQSYKIPLQIARSFNNINHVDANRLSALHYVLIGKRYILPIHQYNHAKMLLENGANPILSCLGIMTPLDTAKQYCNDEMVHLLEQYVER